MNIRLIFAIVLIFGAVAAILYGLKLLGDGMEKLVASGADGLMRKAAKRPAGAYFSGLLIAGITQSSTATSMTAVSMVSAGACTLSSAAALIMGANVGTTVTAQIFAITGGGAGRSVIGAAFLFFGVCASLFKTEKARFAGDASFGLGLVLCGLDAVGGNIQPLIDAPPLRYVLKCDNPILCFLIGVILTAVFQSSSAVTGILVLLCERGDTSFYNAVFVILGSNIGSCFSVAFASRKKSPQAKATAFFNLAFNALGALFVMPFPLFFKDAFLSLFSYSAQKAGKAAADFHTLFNVVSSVAFIPILKPFTNAVSRAFCDKKLKNNKIYAKIARYR